MRIIRRAAVVALAVWLTGLAAVAVKPAYAATKEAIQNVFITNTSDNPVPVAPQGTTQVAGTVTIANPTPAATQPLLVQGSFDEQPITNRQPFASGTLYQVPVGKVLTVEFFQAHWLGAGVHFRFGSLRNTCAFQPSPSADIDQLQLFVQDTNSGDEYHAVGGAVKLLVPGGSCLTYTVGVVSTDLPDGTTLYMYGGFTGYLTDAPA